MALCRGDEMVHLISYQILQELLNETLQQKRTQLLNETLKSHQKPSCLMKL